MGNTVIMEMCVCVAGNYVPVNSIAYIRDARSQLTILNDRFPISLPPSFSFFLSFLFFSFLFFSFLFFSFLFSLFSLLFSSLLFSSLLFSSLLFSSLLFSLSSLLFAHSSTLRTYAAYHLQHNSCCFTSYLPLFYFW